MKNTCDLALNYDKTPILQLIWRFEPKILLQNEKWIECHVFGAMRAKTGGSSC
jgi:hypothetical protein